VWQLLRHLLTIFIVCLNYSEVVHVLSLFLKAKNTANGTDRIVCMRGQYRSISDPEQGQMTVIFYKNLVLFQECRKLLKLCQMLITLNSLKKIRRFGQDMFLTIGR